MASLRRIIADLEAAGDLRRIDHEFDPRLEIAHIQRRAFAAKAPALLFTRVKGCAFPMLANLYGTRERLRFIFRRGLPRTRALLQGKTDPLSLLRKPAAAASALRGACSMPPKKCASAPVLECEAAIADLPKLVSWPADGGPFITLPLVLSEDPDKPGALNLGMYRVQLGGNDYVPIRKVVMNALEKIENAAKASGTVTGIPTGFIDLDYRTAGLQPSDLILIAARPSMGKTAFVLNIAQYVAFHENMCTAIFSLEMSKEQLVNRLFSLESRVDAQALRTGNLSDTDWEKLIEGAGTIGNSELIIDDTPGISIAEMRSKCRKYKLEHDLKLIIIDYLQLMSGSGKSSDSRQQEIADISRSLKALARELSVPVIALSQLSRAVEQRPDHRPMLSDLRESGAIEQDADVVMFIYRDDYYNHDSEMKGISEIIIAKQRNGPIGTVNLVWLPQYTKFANMEK